MAPDEGFEPSPHGFGDRDATITPTWYKLFSYTTTLVLDSNQYFPNNLPASYPLDELIH